jgi:hypothetical protein
VVNNWTMALFKACCKEDVSLVDRDAGADGESSFTLEAIIFIL